MQAKEDFVHVSDNENCEKETSLLPTVDNLSICNDKSEMVRYFFLAHSSCNNFLKENFLRKKFLPFAGLNFFYGSSLKFFWHEKALLFI